MSAKSKSFDIIGIGCSAWDLLGTLNYYPQPGEKEKLSRFEGLPGGQIQTALVTATRLGGKTAIIDTVGDDPFGKAIVASLLREGIDITHLYERTGKTSLVALCIIVEETGERAIIFSTGTKKFLKEEEIVRDFILNCRCLMLDNHHGKASSIAAEIAKEAHIPVVTDIERDNPYNEKLFCLGTHHILPEDYLFKYTGEKDPEKGLKAIYKNCKPKVAIVTLGAKGSIAYTGKDFIHQPAYKIENIVDTTGAGDVFHGAFASGLILNYDLKTNLQFASLVAALKCRELGGQTAIPYKEELKDLWELPLF